MSQKVEKSKKTKMQIFMLSNVVIAAVLAVISIITFSGGYGFTAFGQKSNKAVYQGDTSKNEVSLMVNVYWGTEFIEPMLDVFDRYRTKTTFFVGGTWVQENPEMLKKIVERGHEIGNHGFHHKDHDKLSEAQNRDEIYMCGVVVEQAAGVKMNLFAPPSGAFSQTTLKVAEELGYTTVMWSKDTIDWRDKNADLAFKRATNKMSAGDLVLMHPTAHTLEALPDILEYCKNNGFAAVTVSQNIGQNIA